jgi:pimeloyl-ACP methyl ester carboxylesterase
LADFLLIHGSCHGAWCWRDLIPALEARGHKARAIDLPGHNDGRDLSSVTLEETAEAILMAAGPDTIVLGHSWAGYPISAAAEKDPSRLRGLIYLCAYVPTSGLSMIDMRKRGPRQTLAHAVIKDEDSNSYTIDRAEVPRLFYHDCPEEAVTYALERLCPQPIRPQDTPLTIGSNWESTSKAYIRCAGDQTIPPEYQADMVKDWPAERLHVMETSHSPFFAAPDALADLITRIEKDL